MARTEDDQLATGPRKRFVVESDFAAAALPRLLGQGHGFRQRLRRAGIPTRLSRQGKRSRPLDSEVLESTTPNRPPSEATISNDHARTNLPRCGSLDPNHHHLGTGASLTAEASQGLKPFLLIDAHDPASGGLRRPLTRLAIWPAILPAVKPANRTARFGCNSFTGLTDKQNGGPGWTRTSGLHAVNMALYQLSYWSILRERRRIASVSCQGKGRGAVNPENEAGKRLSNLSSSLRRSPFTPRRRQGHRFDPSASPQA